MNKTKFKQLLFKIISWIISVREDRPIFFGFLKVVFVGIPAFILAYATLELGSPLLWQQPLREALKTHPGLVFACLGWTILSSIIIQALSSLITIFEDRNLPKVQELMALLTALDRVVGIKMERFGKYSKSVTADIGGDTAFRAITKPDAQIDYLIKNLFILLTSLTKDETLKIVLARMENTRPINWTSFMPDDVHPDDSILRNEKEQSLFSHCAKAKNPIIISDIANHLEKAKKLILYLRSDLPGENEGSIICFPVHHDHSGKVIYCLSIKSQKPHLICERFNKKYGFMVQEFIKRINLEHSLEIIKERAGK